MNLFRPKRNFFYYLMAPFRLPGRLLASLSKPSARGKIWWATAGVLILFLASASLDYPEPWNSAANWVSAQASRLHLPSNVKAPHFWDVPYRFGLDLQGGTHLVYEADVKGIPDSERDAAMEGVRDVIERRVNAFGVAEPLIQTNKSGGNYRIIAELAGVKDVNQAIKMIGETPILEFKEQNDNPQIKLTPDQQKMLDAQNAITQKQAETVLAKALAEGVKLDFGGYAKQYSQDAAGKDKGGSLGLIERDGPYGDLWTWADAHQKEPISRQLVESLQGWNIVKVTGSDSSQTEIAASHLLICFKGATACSSDLSKTDALKKIQSLRATITPQNFEAVAKANSTEPGADKGGGNLGWFAKGRMVKAFENAAFALKKGEISQPVETEFGYHLIYERDERPLVRYNVSRVLFKKLQASDILPPADQWKNTSLSGKDLKRASVEFDRNTNEPQVVLEFNDEGKKLFGDITSRNVGKLVGIFLDGQPISVPRVRQAITDGNAVISGNFDYKEAKLLAQRLNAGALPVPINLLSQQTIGASLGKDSLGKSLFAGMIGFLIVAAFMLLYYRLPGLLAALALGIYTAMTLAIFKLWPVTLTLSGIAGVILSIGMAVDANILIFERMREERKNGRSLESSVDEGFKRAWTSIRDSNVSSLITCFILYSFTASSVRGFAVTLAIGILVSMFSAITITRTLLRLIAPWTVKHEWLFK